MTSSTRSAVRGIAYVTSLAALAILLGCRSDSTVWKIDVPSPGGAWIATARTRQEGGFGSAWVETTVSLTKVDKTVNGGHPFDVLSYPGGGAISKAYALSDQNADTDLQLTWSTPTHLQIYHRSHVNPDLEVVRFANVDISFRQGSSQP